MLSPERCPHLVCPPNPEVASRVTSLPQPVHAKPLQEPETEAQGGCIQVWLPAGLMHMGLLVPAPASPRAVPA